MSRWHVCPGQGSPHQYAGILHNNKLKQCDPWGTQGMCHWIHIIIMKNNIYGLVGWSLNIFWDIWLLIKWKGRAGRGMIPGVARYVTLNASHHKEQQYIGLGVGSWTVSEIIHIWYFYILLWSHPVAPPRSRISGLKLAFLSTTKQLCSV